jgi:hypothetical protein
MVITVLEARVARPYWVTLQEAFDLARVRLAEGLAASYLAHSSADPEVWRIMTVWASRDAFESMRRTEAIPADVAIFRAAGAEPKLSIFDVTGRLFGAGADFDTD